MAKASKEEQRKAPILRFKGFTDDWEQRKLQNQVQFFSGLTYSPNDVKDAGTFVIRSSNIKDNMLVSADNVYVNPNVANSELVKKDDIIMVVRNGSKNLIGKHALVTWEIDNSVIGAFMTGIRSSEPYFLNALLDTINFKKEIYKNLGATINQITVGNLRKMTFKVPNESEKFKIGNLFKKLNYLLTLYERKLKLLSQVKKYFLDNLFAEKDYPNLRFKGFTDAWEQRKLGDNFKFSQGLQIPIEQQLTENLPGTERFIRIIDITQNEEPPRFIYNATKKGKVTEKDIFFVRYGAVGTIGHGFRGTIANNLFKVEPLYKADSLFLFQQFTNTKFNSKLKAISASTSMPAINFSSLKKLSIFSTCIIEQNKIGKLFENIDNLLTLYEDKQQHLTEIKKTFLNTMFI